MEKSAQPCPCQSGQSYPQCCGPFHAGKARPETAAQLMRSRYCAYALKRIDYLVETTHPETREPGLKRGIAEWAKETAWTRLLMLDTQQGQAGDSVGQVEFIAEYLHEGKPGQLHERSRFKRHKGAWKYLDAEG